MTPFFYPIQAQTAAIRMAGYTLTKQIELLQAMSRLATLSPVSPEPAASRTKPKAKSPGRTSPGRKVAPSRVPKAPVKSAVTKRKPATRKATPQTQVSKTENMSKTVASQPTTSQAVSNKPSKLSGQTALNDSQAAKAEVKRARRLPSTPPSMPSAKAKSDT